MLKKCVKIKELTEKLIKGGKMVKKIKCKIIDSVSFSSDKRSTVADKDCAQSGRESGLFASYNVLLRESSSEQEVIRERLDLLA